MEITKETGKNVLNGGGRLIMSGEEEVDFSEILIGQSMSHKMSEYKHDYPFLLILPCNFT